MFLIQNEKIADEIENAVKEELGFKKPEPKSKNGKKASNKAK
jgi:hypothetical protein